MWTPQCSSDCPFTQSLALFVQSSVSILRLVPNEHYSARILSFFYSVMCTGGRGALSWVKIINAATAFNEAHSLEGNMDIQPLNNSCRLGQQGSSGIP